MLRWRVATASTIGFLPFARSIPSDFAHLWYLTFFRLRHTTWGFYEENKGQEAVSGHRARIKCRNSVSAERWYRSETNFWHFGCSFRHMRWGLGQGQSAVKQLFDTFKGYKACFLLIIFIFSAFRTLGKGWCRLYTHFLLEDSNQHHTAGCDKQLPSKVQPDRHYSLEVVICFKLRCLITYIRHAFQLLFFCLFQGSLNDQTRVEIIAFYGSF